jgi:REP element-mobilizing transposase RayT
MARVARADVFDPNTVSVFHCINRCVRECFLCGNDPNTGRNFDHRKLWLEERLKFLAKWFAIDVLDFAILSNHFHLLLRNRPDIVAAWSDEEVARRWLMICPVRKLPGGNKEEPTDSDLGTIINNPAKLVEIRERLSHISWFMRLIAGPIARRANKEDQVSGRFWQGRFKAIKLCDEAAILGCSVYIGLNVIRAGLAQTPEDSNFTSVQRRIQSLLRPANETEARGHSSPDDSHRPDDWLAPLSLDEAANPGAMPNGTGTRCSDKGFLPMSVTEYLGLLDWSGRQVVNGKRGTIPAHLVPILDRVGIPPDGWLTLATEFERLFQRVAGSCGSVNGLCGLQTGRPFRCHQASLLGYGTTIA